MSLLVCGQSLGWLVGSKLFRRWSGRPATGFVNVNVNVGENKISPPIASSSRSGSRYAAPADTTFSISTRFRRSSSDLNRQVSARCGDFAGKSDFAPAGRMSTERDKYLHMSIEEKRATYKCGSTYRTLADIPSWPALYMRNKGSIDGKVPKNKPRAIMNELLSGKISMWRGDITHLEIDAIVNAANATLLGGGGVDGAIHSSAGPSLKAECATLGGCDTGLAKLTGGYKLPAKYVIHTVGPVGTNPEKLRSCYNCCLNIAKENNARTVAFPCISTGIYGYPNDAAANVALETTRHWLEKNDNATKMDRIIFCLFLSVDVSLYEQLLPVYFPTAGLTQ